MLNRKLPLLLVCAGLVSGCGLAEGVAAFYGFPVHQYTPETLSAKLRPHDRWYFPETSQAAPGVLIVPGCAGTHEFHHEWATFLQEHGFAVLIIDSFAARDVIEPQDLEGVCEGEHTWGFERAGDILVSLDEMRSSPQVDAESLNLMGWSHGGWSVIDAVLLASASKTPPFLTELPSSGMQGVKNVVALYPYCDFGSFVNELPWPTEGIRGWVVLASNDQNIEPQPCYDAIAKQLEQQALLDQHILDVDHWFDNPRGFDVVPHEYAEEETAAVRQEVLRRFSF